MITLRNYARNLALGKRIDHVIMNACSACAFTEEGHPVRITVEMINVLLHPAHGLLLVLQSQISRTRHVLRAQEA